MAMEYFGDQFDAIGVRNQVTVLDEAALPAALSLARRELRALDDACSRFREDSELARLNRDGRGAASPLLLEALEVALQAAESTDGLVDPTVGAAMRALGYDRDFEVVARRGAGRRLELCPATGWRGVRVDHRAATVTLPRDAELDLGATAKAFAADQIATAAHAVTGSPVLVSLGGDIAIAGDAPSDGWPILVTDDSRAAGASGQVVAVHAGGLATSSTTVRRWRAGTVERHHIVDPRTGASARTCWRTVSVAALTCLKANVAATAAIVLGVDAPGWLNARGLSARLVGPEGAIETTGDWPTETTTATRADDPRRETEALGS